MYPLKDQDSRRSVFNSHVLEQDGSPFTLLYCLWWWEEKALNVVK